MLDTPDVRQTTNYDCGAAALDTVCTFFRRAMIDRLSTDADGLHPATIEAQLRRAGFSVQSGRMAVDDLRHHTRLGRLVLCPIDIYGGHWVIVRGATKARVHYQCPTAGRRAAPHDSWAHIWRDSTRAGHAFDNWGIATWVSQSPPSCSKGR